MSPKSAPVALFLLSLTAFESKAEVVLPKVFASHMVLQREIPVPVWGTAAPGETFTVNFRNQSKPVQADPEGKWRVVLDPLAAGGPDVLKVGGKVLEDVLSPGTHLWRSGPPRPTRSCVCCPVEAAPSGRRPTPETTRSFRPCFLHSAKTCRRGLGFP
jgi:hypothetical protein